MLAETVTEAARRWGHRTALVAPDGWTVSFTELDRASDEVAVGLTLRGVREGDVVALALGATPEHVIAYAAAAKLGAIAAGVNARLPAAERAAVLHRAAPRLVLAIEPDDERGTGTPDVARGPADAGVDTGAPGTFGGSVGASEIRTTRRPVEAGETGELVVVPPGSSTEGALAELRVRDASPPPLAPEPERPVAIVFTSGTTGTPKGAVFAGRQLAFISDVDTGGRWGPGGHTIAGTSLAHLGPTTKLAGNLMRGATQHLLARWRAADALALVQRHRMAGIGGIPTQIALMLRDPTEPATDLSSLRAVVVGGGPATPRLVREVRDRWGVALSVRYSCTEAGIGVGTAFDDPPQDAEVSVGRPHDGVTLHLLDDDGHPVADGEVGEVCLRSPAVMSGYWGDPEATAAAFTEQGAVRTGDLGRLDERGRLVLVGRSREMYVRGGYNVFPVAVEAVLADHPGVRELAVAPRHDEVMGELGVAVVVPAGPSAAPTLDELRTFAAPHLAHHELPEALVVVERLPLTAMDKLDRRAVAAMVRREGA